MAYQPWTGIAPDPQVFYQLDWESITVLAYLTWCNAARRPVYLTDIVKLPDEEDKPLGITNTLDILDHITELNICSIRNQNKREARDGRMPLSVFVGGFQKRTFGEAPANVPTTPQNPASRTEFKAPRRERPNRTEQARDDKPQRYFPKTAPEDRIEVESGVFATPSTPAEIVKAFQELQKEVAVTEANTELGKLEKVEAMHAIAIKRVDLYKKWAKAQPGNRKLEAILVKKKRIATTLALQVENARKREAAK